MKKTIRQSALVLAVLWLCACGAAPESQAPATGASQAASAEPAPSVEAPPAEVAVAAHPGEAAYQKTCALCHASTAMGAPMLGSKEAWAPRIAQGSEQLYKHAIEGYVGESGAMPARGGNPSLDDEAMKAAVDFMVAKAQ